MASIDSFSSETRKQQIRQLEISRLMREKRAEKEKLETLVKAKAAAELAQIRSIDGELLELGRELKGL